MPNTSDITNYNVIIFKYVLGILFAILLPFVISKYIQHSELKSTDCVQASTLYM